MAASRQSLPLGIFGNRRSTKCRTLSIFVDVVRRLSRLVYGNAATAPEDMNFRWKFHALGRDLAGHYVAGKLAYAVSVSGNWRITFRFEGADAIDVNLEDDR